MPEPSNKESENTAVKSVGLNVRLALVENSDQPLLANFTCLNGALAWCSSISDFSILRR
jgi:hypothetical protein